MTSAIVVGLGNIGLPIASRVSAVVSTTVLDPDPERRAAWAAMRPGVPAVPDLDQAPWSTIDRVFVVVRQSDLALRILDEIDERATGEVVVHVHTTLDAVAAAALADRSSARLRVLEQPVSGGAAGAESGRLVVLSAGPDTAADVDLLLSAHAGRVVPFADYGQPSLAKLMNNTVAAFNLHVAAWTVQAAADHGIGAPSMLEVLRLCSGGSWIAEMLPDIGAEQVALLAKDVRLLTRSTGEMPAIEPGTAEALERTVELAQRTIDRDETPEDDPGTGDR